MQKRLIERMRLPFAGLASALLCVVLGGTNGALANTQVGVDPSASWIGFMNVFELPSNGGAFIFNSAWGTADLDASFTGPVATLTPNTNIDATNPVDTFWWQTGPGGPGTGEGNKTMDANFYVQNDALAGNTIEFQGNVLSNSLVAPYTTTVFIKDFAPDYSSFTTATVNAAPGLFDLTLPTGVGTHVQYGFETIGPDARLSEVAGFGKVQVTAVPEPITLSALGAMALPLLMRRRSRA
jgi:hypothetical protein